MLVESILLPTLVPIRQQMMLKRTHLLTCVLQRYGKAAKAGHGAAIVEGGGGQHCYFSSAAKSRA